MNWLNTISILLVAFLAVFLESWFTGLRRLVGAQPDLLPALTVYAALSANLSTVVFVATLGGFWLDSLSANPFGISVLPLAATGLMVHYSRGLILRDDLHVQLLVGLAGSAAVPLLTLLSLIAVGEEPLCGLRFLWQWVVMAAGGALFTPLCFRLFEHINRALNYQPEPSLSFRPDREIERGRESHVDH